MSSFFHRTDSVSEGVLLYATCLLRLATGSSLPPLLPIAMELMQESSLARSQVQAKDAAGAQRLGVS